MPLPAVVLSFVACNDAGPAGPVDAAVDDAAFTLGNAPLIVTELPLIDVSASGATGKVTLTRTADGLRADIEVDGLVTGYAYSVWWAIFNNPQGCDAPCDVFDLRNVTQAQGSLINGSGFVGDGSTIFHQTHLKRLDPEEKSVEAGDPRGVPNTYNSEVHIVIRNHGPAETDPADLALQIGSFGPFCNPPGCHNTAAVPFGRLGSPGN